MTVADGVDAGGAAGGSCCRPRARSPGRSHRSRTARASSPGRSPRPSRCSPTPPATGPALVVPARRTQALDGVLIAADADGRRALRGGDDRAVVAFAAPGRARPASWPRRRQAAAAARAAGGPRPDRPRPARPGHPAAVRHRHDAAERAAAGSTTPDGARPRLHRAVDDLDETIRDIRRTIFALQTPEDADGTPAAAWSDRRRRSPRAPGCVWRADGRAVDSAVPAEIGEHAAGRAPRGRVQRGPARGRHGRGGLRRRAPTGCGRGRRRRRRACRRDGRAQRPAQPRRAGPRSSAAVTAGQGRPGGAVRWSGTSRCADPRAAGLRPRRSPARRSSVARTAAWVRRCMPSLASRWET